ncbi:receptor [Fulvivirga sp. M361]|uniref:7TM diverse intracellular signaling domain-containing protein n=1 Tax=Fulvivirga sp. M361 TaxID=2594266 RepID=UPI001179B428|nr:7TM diverse intracellular signaling domain-containing protein [Fulvivirga sp. M361]TRX58457.1 receptor [Fulvivirga sp. M361]
MIGINTLSYILLFSLFSYPEREKIYVDDSVDEVLLPINSLPILVDSVGNMDFEDILQKKGEFTIYTQFIPKDYCVSCTYWIKVPLLISENSEKQWIIEFYDQTIDEITAYFPKDNGEYTRDEVGDHFPFDKKALSHKNFEWLINPVMKDRQDIYFKVRSHSYADIRIALRTVNRFIHYSLNEYFLYGLFYGMIFIITLYNLLIFFAIKEEKYLFYTFYILSVGIYAMCVDGIAFQYLWPNSPQWNQFAYGTALFSLIFWSILFSRRFLSTAVRSPKLDKLLKLALILRTVVFLYALLFDHKFFEYRNIEIIPLTLIFYTSIYIWLRGYKPARFFVLAYGILFLGFLIKALLYLSVIPFVILSYYSLHVCFLLEMLFLTFALSDRVRILKSNRDRALKRTIIQHQENAMLKDKVNKELEGKIKERTGQLEEKNLLLAETNQKLFEQTREINKINSMLDLDNWKLKNNIKEVLRDRLINKNLTLDQFRNIFPDQLTCYRFLDRLKWANGYHCTKCNNTKFSEGHTKFARRCSKCGYDESITSNTIFHRIKFPIEKAFYILYVTNNQPNDFTLDELSEMLQLRRNTVWNFKKKIEEIYLNGDGDTSPISIQNLFSAHVN